MSGIFSADAWEKVWIYKDTFLLGLGNTVLTAVVALVISLVLGILFGLMATSGKKSLYIIARIYVEIIQNTPLILQLCFLYYGLSFSKNSIGIIPTGMISIGIYHGAYVAEVVRAGILPFQEANLKLLLHKDFLTLDKCIILSYHKV